MGVSMVEEWDRATSVVVYTVGFLFGVLSVLGSGVVVYMFVVFKSVRGIALRRVVAMQALADMSAGVGWVAACAALIFVATTPESGMCITMNSWVLYFITASVLWSACVSTELLRTVLGRVRTTPGGDIVLDEAGPITKLELVYHAAAWLLPLGAPVMVTLLDSTGVGLVTCMHKRVDIGISVLMAVYLMVIAYCLVAVLVSGITLFLREQAIKERADYSGHDASRAYVYLMARALVSQGLFSLLLLLLIAADVTLELMDLTKPLAVTLSVAVTALLPLLGIVNAVVYSLDVRAMRKLSRHISRYWLPWRWLIRNPEGDLRPVCFPYGVYGTPLARLRIFAPSNPPLRKRATTSTDPHHLSHAGSYRDSASEVESDSLISRDLPPLHADHHMMHSANFGDTMRGRSIMGKAVDSIPEKERLHNDNLGLGISLDG